MSLDPKHRLHSWLQINKMPLPQYEITSGGSSNPKTHFKALISVKINNVVHLANGKGRSVKLARTAAARSMLMVLKKSGSLVNPELLVRISANHRG